MAIANNGITTIVLLCVLTVIATLVVILRIWRRKRRAFVGLDDSIILAALILVYVQDASGFIFAIKGGQGKPIDTLTDKELKWFLWIYYLPELLYCVLVTIIKASVLISYNRIFGHIKWCRNTIYVLSFLTFAWFIAVFFPFIFQCKPVSKAWTPHSDGECYERGKWFWTSSAANCILDWMILLFPVLPLLKLRLEPLEKTLVWGSFAVGSLTCLASITRAVLNRTADYSQSSNDMFLVTIATYIEPILAVISACLPFLSNTLLSKVYAVAHKVFSRRKTCPSTSIGTIPDDTSDARLYPLTSIP